MARYVMLDWPGWPAGATRAERQPCRYLAYIPDLLMGRLLLLTARRAADVADAESAIAALNGSERSLVSLEALARLLLRAEAVASSHIEGLHIA